MRSVLIAVVLAAAATLSSGAAGQQAATDGAPRISQREFKQLLAAHNVVIVDTRNEEVYRLGHLPGALLLPLEGLDDFPPQYAGVIQQLKAAKKPIVTYCA
jgi:predicted sulfurtransferase